MSDNCSSVEKQSFQKQSFKKQIHEVELIG